MFWDHAFASGKVSAIPSSFDHPLDSVLAFAEKLYAGFCLRRIARTFSEGGIMGENIKLGLAARLINRNEKNAMQIGAHSICKGILRVERNGKLIIGEEVYIGDGTLISAAASVEIGAHTLIAHEAQIYDNTSHPVDWMQREQHFKTIAGLQGKTQIFIPQAPVKIGKNCWLGTRCIILKGVTIGDRSIIGAGSIITRDVPSDTLCFGDKDTDRRNLVSTPTRVP